jgi:hypothetical protein
MTTTTNNTDLICGLKTEISRQVGKKNWEGDCKDFITGCLFKAWKKLEYAEIMELAWDLIETAPYQTWTTVKSDLMGVFSKIGEYTNKKGIKSQAHFSQNGKYLGSVKALGDKPIGYMGNFRITRETFVFDTTNIHTFTDITQLFIPMPLK